MRGVHVGGRGLYGGARGTYGGTKGVYDGGNTQSRGARGRRGRGRGRGITARGGISKDPDKNRQIVQISKGAANEDTQI